MPLDTVFDNHANPTSILNGTIWVPDGAFSWGGTPSTGGGTSCLEMIVNTMQFYGNSAFNSNGCTLSTGGGSGGAGKPIGSSQVTLVD
jgi:hypothetical protein